MGGKKENGPPVCGNGFEKKLFTTTSIIPRNCSIEYRKEIGESKAHNAKIPPPTIRKELAQRILSLFVTDVRNRAERRIMNAQRRGIAILLQNDKPRKRPEANKRLFTFCFIDETKLTSASNPKKKAYASVSARERNTIVCGNRA